MPTTKKKRISLYSHHRPADFHNFPSPTILSLILITKMIFSLSLQQSRKNQSRHLCLCLVQAKAFSLSPKNHQKIYQPFKVQVFLAIKQLRTSPHLISLLSPHNKPHSLHNHPSLKSKKHPKSPYSPTTPSLSISSTTPLSISSHHERHSTFTKNQNQLLFSSTTGQKSNSRKPSHYSVMLRVKWKNSLFSILPCQKNLRKYSMIRPQSTFSQYSTTSHS